MKTRTVIGIDPGLARAGIAIVQRNRAGRYALLHAALVKTEKTTPTPHRLKAVHEKVIGIINETPDLDGMAIERVFFGNNVSSAISTAQVIGVCSLAAVDAGLNVLEITPQQAKAAVTASGIADKKVVKSRVEKLTGHLIRSEHEADAIAIAIAGIIQPVRKFCEGERVDRLAYCETMSCERYDS